MNSPTPPSLSAASVPRTPFSPSTSTYSPDRGFQMASASPCPSALASLAVCRTLVPSPVVLLSFRSGTVRVSPSADTSPVHLSILCRPTFHLPPSWSVTRAMPPLTLAITTFWPFRCVPSAHSMPRMSTDSPLRSLGAVGRGRRVIAVVFWS